MTRVSGVRRAAAIAAAGLVLAGVSPAALAAAPNSPAATARPNVLLLNADDWRANPAGVSYSAYLPKTWRWLSRTAVSYDAAEVPNPNCCPSRASLMTGRYDHNNGVRTQADAFKLNYATTVQSYLRGGGYQTGLVGKFLNSFPQRQAPPDFGYYAMWETNKYQPPYSVDVNGRTVTATKYATTYFGDQMLAALKSFAANPGQPWYLYGAPHAPHSQKVRQPNGTIEKLAVPERKYAQAPVPACAQPGEADTSDQPPYVRNTVVPPAHSQRLCASQLRAMMSVDDAYDRVFRYLANTGQLARTLVIITSDNGVLWGEHNRNSKFVPFLPSIRVPLLVRWPGHLAPGRSARPVSNVDIAPTILEAAGVKPDPAAPLDGHSLLGTTQRTKQFNEYWKDPANDNVPTWAQLHTDAWAYAEYYDATGQVIFRSYYDLTSDPAENQNLLGDSSTANDPPNLAGLSAELASLRSCAGASCP